MPAMRRARSGKPPGFVATVSATAPTIFPRGLSHGSSLTRCRTSFCRSMATAASAGLDPCPGPFRALLEHSGKSAALIRHVTNRPAHDRRYAVDWARADTELAWRATVSLRGRLGLHRGLVSGQRHLGRPRSLWSLPFQKGPVTSRVRAHQEDEQSAHGSEWVTTSASGFVGWVQPAIRPGVMVGCTHPTAKALTHPGL